MMPHGVEIFVCLEPIDLRWSFEQLSNLAAARVGREARCGALFVFFGRRHDALKILFFDGTGMCQFYKRLDRHRFKVPVAADARVESISLEEHELEALLDGLELTESKAPRRGTRRSEPPIH
jgi:transposase